MVLCISVINNGNRTEWSPILSVILRVITKVGRPRSRFVNHDYDYRQNWTTRSPVNQLIITISISEKNTPRTDIYSGDNVLS